ncbi:L-lactate transporter [subsurface metagenome]
MTEDRKPKFFYGYIVVGAGFVIQLLMWGTYRTYGIFFTPLSSEFGWTSTETSGAYSLAYLLCGVLAIIAGRLSDKLGPRVVLITCGLFLGVGYLLMSQVSSIWQLYLFLGVMVGAGNSGADAPILSTVARWFVRRRGTVTGITKAGVGIGMLIIPLLATWLISSYSWRNAYVVIGIISLVGVVSAALFLKRDPEQVGQLPDGVTMIEQTDSNIDTPQFSLRKAVVIRQFWIFSAVWFLLSFCTQIVMLHIPPHIIGLGISATVAAAILGTIGGVSILGRIGMGSVSDRLGNKATFIIALSFLVIALAWVQFAREAWMFYLFATLYGIAHGAFFTLISPTLAELFGLRSLGTIFGVVSFAGTVGGALGPVLSGRIFDITSDYQPAFLICLALSVVAVILMFFLKPTSNETLRKIC